MTPTPSPGPSPDPTLIGNVTSQAGPLAVVGILLALLVLGFVWFYLSERSDERARRHSERLSRTRYGTEFHNDPDAVPFTDLLDDSRAWSR